MTYAAIWHSSQPLLPRSTALPCQPGLYWFHSELIPWKVMVEVYEKDGHLTMWWLNQELPVASLQGFWRGPIRPFGEPTS